MVKQSMWHKVPIKTNENPENTFLSFKKFQQIVFTGHVKKIAEEIDATKKNVSEWLKYTLGNFRLIVIVIVINKDYM